MWESEVGVLNRATWVVVHSRLAAASMVRNGQQIASHAQWQLFAESIAHVDTNVRYEINSANISRSAHIAAARLLISDMYPCGRKLFPCNSLDRCEAVDITVPREGTCL